MIPATYLVTPVCRYLIVGGGMPPPKNCVRVVSMFMVVFIHSSVGMSEKQGIEGNTCNKGKTPKVHFELGDIKP